MTVAQVRVLTSDLPIYDRAAAVADGDTVQFHIAQHPVIEGSYALFEDGILQTEPADYSMDAEVGLIVMAAAPLNNQELVLTYRHAILSDDQINVLLSLESNVYRAAALALDTIASNEALVQKKMTLLDVQTDGPAVAKALRDHAKVLRGLAADEAAALEAGAFDIAEMIFWPFGWEQRIYDEALRGRL